MKDEIVLLVLYSFVFIVGTFGNGLVIRSFASNTAAGAKFVVALAAVDFLTSIWAPLQRILLIIFRFHNFDGDYSLDMNIKVEIDLQHFTHDPLGDIPRRIINRCWPALIDASSWLLFAISCERLR